MTGHSGCKFPILADFVAKDLGFGKDVALLNSKVRPPKTGSAWSRTKKALKRDGMEYHFYFFHGPDARPNLAAAEGMATLIHEIESHTKSIARELQPPPLAGFGTSASDKEEDEEEGADDDDAATFEALLELIVGDQLMMLHLFDVTHEQLQQQDRRSDGRISGALEKRIIERLRAFAMQGIIRLPTFPKRSLFAPATPANAQASTPAAAAPAWGGHRYPSRHFWGGV